MRRRPPRFVLVPPPSWRRRRLRHPWLWLLAAMFAAAQLFAAGLSYSELAMALTPLVAGLWLGCCCAGTCICYPELEALGFPDLLVCFVSHTSGGTEGVDCPPSPDGQSGCPPCDECFATERCLTLNWTGQHYEEPLLGEPDIEWNCGDGDQIFPHAYLDCEGVLVPEGCQEPLVPLPDVTDKWVLRLICNDENPGHCFQWTIDVISCDPLLFEGVLCDITTCCGRDEGGFPKYGCIDAEVTLAP